MDSPYFNTYLIGRVALQPSQMDNNIYRHLKDNLTRIHQGKCYNDFGFIQKIYKIEERKGGEIIAEDPTAAAVYDVKFSCRLCRPLIGTTIVCEVVGINRSIVFSVNGPIFVVLEDQHINQNNFTFDERHNVLVAKMGKVGKPVLKGSYVKIKITGTKISNNAKKIIATGTLESLATEEEKVKMIEEIEQFDTEERFIEYQDIENEKYKNQNQKEEPEIVSETESQSESETETEIESETE